MKNKAPGYKQVKAAGGVGETVRTIIYAVAIAIAVRTFAYEPFNIPSGSMMPTLLIGDYLFVSKFSYGYSRYSLPFGLPFISGRIFFHQPRRGDVVVFKVPKDNSTDFIKRVVGLPGDKIQVIGGTLYVNDVAAKRTWVGKYSDSEDSRVMPTVREEYEEDLPNGARHMILLAGNDAGSPPKDCTNNRFTTTPEETENTCPFIVPPGHYFMMGDNRDNSLDSRVMGSGVGFVPAENLVGRAEFIFFSTDGAAQWWEFWKWPFAVRYDRLFKAID
ncbi:MAG TPA: signal peptidase I [Stellaceae bacterium]|nr:signal peptidase I [Stellaceae bacterium]